MLRHTCNEMQVEQIRIEQNDNTDKIDIYFLNGIPNLEVTTISDDSSYGPAEENVWLQIKFCPFCGQNLMNTV